MIVPTSNLFKLAYGKYAIVNNLEQTLGFFKGCIESQAPFIIQLSKGARKYADKGMLEGGWSGLGYTGSFSATTPNSSTSDLPAKSLWRSTPSLSPVRARNLGQQASYHSFARRSPEK